MPTTVIAEMSIDLGKKPAGFPDDMYVQMMVTYALFKAQERHGIDLRSVPKQLKVGIDQKPCAISLIFAMSDDASGLKASKAIEDEFEKAKAMDVMDIIAWANS